MSRRVSNRQVKALLVRTNVQGRLAFWFGEESEVFVAPSLEALIEYFKPKAKFDPDIQEALDEKAYGLIEGSKRSQWWWQLVHNIDYPVTKSSNWSGAVMLPTFTDLHRSGKDDVVLLFTAYY